MEAVKSYVLSVTAAALFCAVVNGLFDKNGTFSKILKVMTNVLMMIVLIYPLIQNPVRLPDTYVQDFSAEADRIASNAQAQSREKICSIIIDKTEAYIINKAADLNVTVFVSVSLDEDGEYPVPAKVQIRGNVSPYAKQVLSKTISDDLRIAAEDQMWN